MPATVPTSPPLPLPPALTGWAFFVGRRTREQLQLAVVGADGLITFAKCAP